MAISDLPGYVQGYKFDDTDSTCWNSSREFFIDQAGYSANPASRLELVLGSTYSFVDVNSARGLVLDNQAHWICMPPMLWHGSMIAVIGAPSRMGSNGTIYPIIGGAEADPANNSALQLIRVGASDYRHRQVGSGGSNGEGAYADDGIYATCFSGDQENRVAKGMESDGTISTGSTVADNDKGVEFFKDVGAQSYTYGRGLRIGNVSGVQGSLAASSLTCVICELHFFTSILTDAPTTDVETELAALEAIYG